MRSRPLPFALLLLVVAGGGCFVATGPARPDVDGLEIEGPPEVTARVGASIRLKARAYERQCDFESCQYFPVAVTVNWKSTDPDVAVLITDAAGKRANLLRPGAARIIASGAGYQDTLAVTVVP